jgi:hypothetical protein
VIEKNTVENLIKLNDDLSTEIKPVDIRPKSKLHIYDYDIDIVDMEVLQSQIIDDIIRRAREKLPATFLSDRLNEPFPI